MNIKYIPYEQLSVEPGFNTRYELGDIQELSESIINNGLEIPIIVVPAPDGIKYFVRSGHRRFAAITHAYERKELSDWIKSFPFDKIPCEVREKYEKEKQILDIVTHNSGKPLLPLEEAETYKRLREECGWDDKKIASRTGKKRPQINRLLSLAYAGEKIKELVKNNTLLASAAIEIIALHPESEDLQLMEISGALDNAIESGSSRVTSQHVDKIKEKKPLPKFKMLMNKIEVENVANKTAIDPTVRETLKVINALLFEDQSIVNSFSKLKSIKQKQ